MLQCDDAIMLECDDAIMLECDDAIMLQCGDAIMLQCGDAEQKMFSFVFYGCNVDEMNLSNFRVFLV